MTLSSSVQRIVLLLLALVCVGLIGWSGMRAGALLVEARTNELHDAERAITQATAPVIEQNRIPNRLVLAVQALIDDRTLHIDFVTLRNADNVTLVSRGRLREEGLNWLPFGDSRALRSWLYRARSAEAYRPILRAERRVGSAHFGVGWTDIAGRAGIPLFIWATALLAGVIGLFGLLMRSSALTQTQRAQRPVQPVGTPNTGQDNGERARVPRSRFRRRGFDPEFAPIANPRPTPAAAGPDVAKQPPNGDQVGRQESPVVPPPAEKPSAEPITPVKLREPVAPAAVEIPDTQSEQASAPPLSVEMPVAEGRRPDFEAPRIDATPALGDSTLDLRFYPIWRGSDTQRVLSGACAALAWRAGEAELVDADTLTRLAEKDGALRAFTQWIARRFSLLHGNWRTLELNTVPIVLPIPSAMLAFADAETVWRDALRRTDRDPNDLILRLDNPVAAAAHATLPLRRALPAADPADELPDDCDVLCVGAEQLNGNASAWSARFDALDCPVLFGPVTDPAKYSEILAHERVLWFSQQDDDVYSPRAFARLLARTTPEPM